MLAPADLSAALIIFRTVAELLTGWAGVPAEALLAGAYHICGETNDA